MGPRVRGDDGYYDNPSISASLSSRSGVSAAAMPCCKAQSLPLQPGGRIGNPEGLLLSLGVVMIQTIILIQVTGLTILAARQSSTVIEELDLDDPLQEFLDPSRGSRSNGTREAVSARSDGKD